MTAWNSTRAVYRGHTHNSWISVILILLGKVNDMFHNEAMPTTQVVTQRYLFLIPSQLDSAKCRIPSVIKKTLVWQT